MLKTGLGRMPAIAAASALASLVMAGPANALDVGQKAPDFTLPPRAASRSSCRS